MVRIKVSVHNNPTISSIDKFNYLRMFVDYPAATTLDGYAVTDGNYTLALKALTQRYGRVDVVEASHYSTLNNLPDASQKGETKPLRKLYDTASSTIRSLETLGVDANTYQRMAMPLILARLPTDLVVTWTKESKTTSNIENLLEFIRKDFRTKLGLEVDGVENLQIQTFGAPVQAPEP